MTRRTVLLTAVVAVAAAITVAWRRVIGLLEMLDRLDDEHPNPS